MKHPDTVIQLFARAPVAGEVNTRLIPYIGEDRATSLQVELVRDRLKNLIEAQLCDVQLWCSPDASHELFIECDRRYPLALHEQQGRDLGERMSAGILTGFRQYRQVVLIGTDAPALDVAAIDNAIDALSAGNNIVLSPAKDGGYVLIGMRQYFPEVFLSVPWGTDRVLTKTRANVVALGQRLFELEPCWDIDRLEDYQRYMQQKQEM